ncbi:FkbM family methyltransferase [bacterium]|nr:FkbM family methyltransferase [bacterium]
MLGWIKKKVIGSRLEGPARWLYIRLDPSIWGQYDRQTLAVFKRYLKPDSNCIDIGAHRGSMLREIIARAPEGKHFAFEPLPEPAQYLAKAFPDVEVHPLALSNHSGEVAFTLATEHPTRSSFKLTDPTEPKETITVKTERLDNVIPADLPIRLIKLDVEGAELQVLQGGIKTIRKNKPVIVFEHSDLAVRNYGIQSEAVYDLLTSECGLHISLLPDWLKGKNPLSCNDFKEQVTSNQCYFFIAHP